MLLLYNTPISIISCSMGAYIYLKKRKMNKYIKSPVNAQNMTMSSLQQQMDHGVSNPIAQIPVDNQGLEGEEFEGIDKEMFAYGSP